MCRPDKGMAQLDGVQPEQAEAVLCTMSWHPSVSHEYREEHSTCNHFRCLPGSKTLRPT